MRYAFIDAEKDNHSVRMMCRLFAVTSSGYYRWRARTTWRQQRQQEEAKLAATLRSVFEEHRCCYGVRRMHAEMRAKGCPMGHRRIRRIMRAEGLKPRCRRSFVRTTRANPSHRVSSNIVARDFQREKPNEVWVGDITYLRTREGWLYLAILLDLFSRKVVGWSMSDTMTTQLVTDTLQMAIGRRPGHGSVIHHTDRGCQYTSDAYQTTLARNGLISSMSRPANCWDNAVAETFFGTLKTELGDTFYSRQSAKAELFDYIEVFYNRTRRHSSLGYLSPQQFEAIHP